MGYYCWRMHTIPKDFLDFAHRLADQAGTVLRGYFRQPIGFDAKSDSSPVTVADREAEHAMRELIEKHYPTHGILGEEYGESNPEAEYIWVLDPIDGTKSFITGKPIFGTLVSLVHNGLPIIGIIDQPITQERWVGVGGKPTLYGEGAIRPRACSKLADAILSTTSPDLFKGQESLLFNRVKAQARYTVYGGDCYAYGLLAAGFIDVIVESGLQKYDFCALLPVLEGAGATVTDWQGRPIRFHSDGNIIAAATPKLHAQVLSLLTL